jgi:DNA helicase-2/ATP-dependent DNA helicase PcrA
LETALRQAGVRYHLIGGQSFFDRREIKDLFAYLKTFVNPHDDVSLLRIANVPARGLSDVTMERLLAASHERKTSVYAVMKHTDVQAEFSTKTREAIMEFVAWVERHRQILTQPNSLLLSAWAEKLLTDTGYVAELRRSEKKVETAENRVRNLKDLVATMDNHVDLKAANPMDRLQNFIEEVTLDSEREEDQETPGDAVTLITMHSCKGLEFPHVHIVGLEDGLLPHSRSKVEGTLDEERRLFYVAITRAMQTLRISYCGSRKRYGQPMPCHPSPFLRELPEELVENADEQSRKPVTRETGKSYFASMRSAIE